MSAYELLLLNTSIPQIQAAQSGDTYVCPRDIAINATAIISANSATDALRITQTGAGNALLVEDSTNPDSTPFVVTAAGDVGIGATSPTSKLDIYQSSARYVRAYPSSGLADLEVVTNNNVQPVFSVKGTGTADLIRAYAGATQALTLDSSGNLGLGVTPSAWTTTFGLKAMQVYGSALASNGTSGYLTNNAYYATASYTPTYIAASSTPAQAITFNRTGANDIQFLIGPAGTAGNTISFNQAMTLDASGNLVVGSTSPDLVGSTTSITIDKASGNGQLSLAANGTVRGRIFADNGSSEFRIGNPTSNPLTLFTANAERARITSGGDFRVKGAGTAGSTDAFQISGSAPADAARLTSGGEFLVGTTNAIHDTITNGLAVVGTAAVTAIGIGHVTGSGSGTNYASFNYNGASIGSITQNGTTGVLYNITSDYRLKNVVGAVTDAGARIDALKPVDYTWKADGSAARGFLAHEFQEVYPNSVTGTKDAVDDDGKPVYQNMQASTSEVIADLVAELQSLRARVAQLEAKGV